MVRRGDVGRRPESPLRTMGEIPEMDVGEIEACLPLIIELQTHPLMRERLTHVVGFAFVRQKAALRDLFDLEVGCIHQRFVLLIVPAGTGLVKLAGPLLAVLKGR